MLANRKPYFFLLLAIALLGFWACRFFSISLNPSAPRAAKIAALPKYKKAKEALLKNIDYLQTKYPHGGKVHPRTALLFSGGNNSYWVAWEAEHPDLALIEEGWQENLFQFIKIYENNAVYFESVFRARALNGTMLHHHIVYEPQEKELRRKYRGREMEVKVLQDDWYYLVLALNN